MDLLHPLRSWHPLNTRPPWFALQGWFVHRPNVPTAGVQKTWRRASLWLLGIIGLLGIVGLSLFVSNVWAATPPNPPAGFNLSLNSGDGSPQSVSQTVQILLLLTVLSLAPSILVMMTAFTRIVIVLSLLRQAMGTPMLPPNQVLVAMALILTFFVMAPTFDKINTQAFQPFMAQKITQEVAFERTMEPMRLFMFKQTNQSDIALFIKLAKLKRPRNTNDVPTHVLLPAFIMSEVKTGFQMGFVMFLPFLIIDLVISSILVSMGMMFLPPATVALPFKLVLFVLIDGWQLLCQALVLGFKQ